MGSQSSSQTFAPAEDFGNELQDYLLDAPVLQVPSLRLSLHPVTGFTRVFTGTAAVFTRDTVAEADALLKTVVGLSVQSPVFPTDIVFRQKPKTSQFEFLWIIKEGVQPPLIEWYFQHVCVIKSKPGIIQCTRTEPIEHHPPYSFTVVELPKGQKARIVSYRAKSLRTANPLLSAALSHIRLKHEFIRSLVDMGVVKRETDDFEMYIGVEEIDDNLAQEMERRKTAGTRFSENEFLYTLGQIASGLDYLQDSSVNFHLTTETVLMTADGKFTLDIGVPWPVVEKQETLVTSNKERRIQFCQLAHQIATFDRWPPGGDYEESVSILAYTKEVRQLLLCICQLTATFSDVAQSTSELTIGRYLTQYEAQIARKLMVCVLKTRASVGAYHFRPSCSIKVHFEPPRELTNGLFFGEWNASGQKHGRGVMIFPNETLYEGCWQNDQMGRHGRFVWPPDCVYEGEIADKHVRVYGKHWKNGGIGAGEYFSSLSGLHMDGYGKLESEEGNFIYEGTWIRGYTEGWGIATISGVTFERRWKGGRSIRSRLDS